MAWGWIQQPENAGLLNLIAALLVFLAGAAILWFSHPKVFTQYAYTRRTFVFWVFQWFMLIVAWATYKKVGGHSSVVLACTDLYVVAGLGLYWAYVKSEDFRWQNTIQNLAGIYGALLLWNLLLATWAKNMKWRQIWVLPSETLSLLAIGLLACAFLLRYGGRAIPLSLIAMPAYVFLQRPTYASLFVEDIPDDAHWMVALAFGKLLYGLVFYTLFFSPAENEGPVKIPHPDFRSLTFSKVAKVAAGIVGGAALSLLSDQLAHLIARMLKFS